jgi:hypothetical protein
MADLFLLRPILENAFNITFMMKKLMNDPWVVVKDQMQCLVTIAVRNGKIGNKLF